GLVAQGRSIQELPHRRPLPEAKQVRSRAASGTGLGSRSGIGALLLRCPIVLSIPMAEHGPGNMLSYTSLADAVRFLSKRWACFPPDRSANQTASARSRISATESTKPGAPEIE